LIAVFHFFKIQNFILFLSNVFKNLAQVNLQWKKKFQPKKSWPSTLSCHIVLINILKSFDINSTTLRKIENFDGEDCSLIYFLICVKFHGQIIIKCSTF